MVGESFKFGPNEVPAKPEHAKFAEEFWELSRGLLESGKVKVHKPSVDKYGKGLEGALKGMQASMFKSYSESTLSWGVELLKHILGVVKRSFKELVSSTPKHPLKIRTNFS